MKKAFAILAVFLAACLGVYAATPAPCPTQEACPTSSAPVTETQSKTAAAPTPSRTPRPTKTDTATPTANPLTEDRYFLAECWENAFTQQAMDQCAVQQEQNSYQALQNLLEELRAKLDAQEWNDLADVQTEWETYRKGDCEFHGSFFEGGSLRPLVVQLCLHDHNTTRIKLLKYLLCDGEPECGESEKY